MALSLLDMPTVWAAVSDLYRILENPTSTNAAACRIYRWATGRTTLGERDPDTANPAGIIQAGIEWALFQFGEHTRSECPEITDSLLDLQTKVALVELRDELVPVFASHTLATNAGVRLRFLMFLANVLDRILLRNAPDVPATQANDQHARDDPRQVADQPHHREGTGTSAPGTGEVVEGAQQGKGGKPPADPHADRPARDTDQPSLDRQNDILAAIRAAGMPLTRPELIEAMKLKSEGALGRNLAWMVRNNVLINVPQRGYWPAGGTVPE